MPVRWGMLEPAAYRAAFRRDVAALATAARQDLAAAVPSCPGWNVAMLVAHLTGMYAHCTAQARAGAATTIEQGYEGQGLPAAYTELLAYVFDEATPPTERIAPAIPPGLVDLFEQTAATMDDALGLLEPSAPIWTWWPPDQTPGFWQRRMAHETAIHRWDTELAYGTPTPPETNLAADGVDENFDVIVTARPKPAGTLRSGVGEVFHFHRTDGVGEWLLRFDRAGVTITREHTKADIAIHGSGSDLFLWLWQRIPADTLEVSGDAALLRRYFELIPPG